MGSPLLPLLLLVGVVVESEAVVMIHPQDQLTFQSFYQATNGATWLSSPPLSNPCGFSSQYAQIACNDVGRIIFLYSILPPLFYPLYYYDVMFSGVTS